MRIVAADHQHPFTSSNVPIDEPLYAAGTTYALGDEVYIRTEANWAQDDFGETMVYKSIQPDNLGNDPATSPTFWTRVGPTNRWALRDATSGVMTYLDGDIIFEIDVANPPYEINVNTVAVGFCIGKSVTIEIPYWEDPDADDSYDLLGYVHHCDDATDDSGKGADLVLSGGAAFSSNQSKFGGSSLYFDGVDGKATIAGAAARSPEGADFCIDLQVYCDVLAREETIYSHGNLATGPFIQIKKNLDNTLSAYASDTGTAAVTLDTGFTFAATTWYSLRLSRHGDTWRVFVEGAMQGTQAWSGTLALSGSAQTFGANPDGSLPFQGYVDELRGTYGDSRGDTNSYAVQTEEYNSDPITEIAPVTLPLSNETFATSAPLWWSIFDGHYPYRKERTDTIFLELPQTVLNPNIKITIEKGDSYRAGCGAIGWGYADHVATTNWGATAGITDYSQKKVNDFGVAEFVVRPYAPKISATVEIEKELVNSVIPQLAWLRARPCFWDFNNLTGAAPSELMTPLILVGYFANFEYKLVDVEHYEITLDIEGMI